jgi:hypothetical protein
MRTCQPSFMELCSRGRLRVTDFSNKTITSGPCLLFDAIAVVSSASESQPKTTVRS